jgi:hypothetical protein
MVDLYFAETTGAIEGYEGEHPAFYLAIAN